jgi:integrase
MVIPDLRQSDGNSIRIDSEEVDRLLREGKLYHPRCLRVSEVLGLQIGDVDVRGETLHVERRQRRDDIDDPKSGSGRRARRMGGLAHELLRFAGRRGSEDFSFLQRVYFEGLGMRTFRRLNVTWRQAVGATSIEAQKAAGHASLDMTFLYTQTDDAREREHVN